ncbi:MAG: hypothetical protein HGA37_15855, partial [Lentimicrobium sp.]|nr:hypothetical protein [Lentimicrobium sp.]
MNTLRLLKKTAFHILLLSFLTIPVSGVFAQASDPDKLKQFEDAILRGEEFLAAKDYAKAKAEYQKALVIDPAAKYPKDKLTYIRKFYVDPEDEARFAKAIETGNQLLTARNYAGALEQFSLASNIKPEDKNARDNMAKADKLAKEQNETDKQYAKLIADADKFFTGKDLTAARQAYVAASILKAEEAYPRQRINEIDTKNAAEKSLNEAYDKALTEGDDAYSNRDYTTATLKYEQALKLKPGENYPKSMLERVMQGSANLKDAQQNYQTAIASADRLFNSKDYETALTAYQNASKILPEEKYPAQQIEKINVFLQQKQKLEEEYAKTVSAGNQFFEAKQYNEARTEFQKANNLKPEEAFPKQKIEEIAGLLLAIKDAERDKNYKSVLATADQLYDAKDYETAIAKYKEAAEIKAEETYPHEKITAINKLMADEIAAKNAYDQAIATGDQSFNKGEFEPAITAYQTAISLQPG